MNPCVCISLAVVLFAVTFTSCKKDTPAAFDPVVSTKQLERLTTVFDALVVTLNPTISKDDRARKIARLQSLLDEDAKKESDAYIQTLKANPKSLTSITIPPIRFAKPSGHDYLPELTDLQVEQLQKVIAELEKFFTTHEHSTVFLSTLAECTKVLNEHPGLKRPRLRY